MICICILLEIDLFVFFVIQAVDFKPTIATISCLPIIMIMILMIIIIIMIMMMMIGYRT